MRLETFSLPVASREPNSVEFEPSGAGYSAYGPQRVIGRPVRHDPRRLAATLGESGDTPNPDLPTAKLREEWLGGDVTIHRGEWGYIGPIPGHEEFGRLSETVNLRIIGVAGPDGNATFYFKTGQTPNGDIPTGEYVGGTNNWPARAIAGQGEWHRPGIVSSIARLFSVNPLILAGLVAGAFFLRRYFRRSNPWYEVHRIDARPMDIFNSATVGPEPLFLESSLRAAKSRAGKYNRGERKKGLGVSWGWRKLKNPRKNPRRRKRKKSRAVQLFGASTRATQDDIFDKIEDDEYARSQGFRNAHQMWMELHGTSPYSENPRR